MFKKKNEPNTAIGCLHNVNIETKEISRKKLKEAGLSWHYLYYY